MKPYYAAILFGLLITPWISPFAPGPSPAAVPLLFSWFCILAVVGFAVTRRVAADRLISVAAWSWLIAGVISGAIGLLQYFGAAAELSPWVNQTRYGEAFANLRQRNQFATLTNIGLAALVWMVLRYLKRADELKTQYLWLATAAAGLLVVGNAISSSRTGLLQLVLIYLLHGVWGSWRLVWIRRLLLGAVLVYAVATFATPYLAGLDLSAHGAFARLGQDDACSSRLMLWSNVLHLIAQKPWLGWGWGELDYAHFITLYHEPRFCDILDNAHNLPLQLAVELGVPFALLVCGGFTWWALRQKPWAERDATRQMAWAVIAVILLHSMLEYPLWYGPFQMAFGICVLLLWRQTQPLEAENSSKKVSNWPSALILQAQSAAISIASILLLFIAYAAWDYHRISQIYLEPESRSAAYRTDTLSKIRSSWLFADQVQFAELLVTPLTPANAAWTFKTAGQVLHHSPEPRVIEKLIESAVMLGKDDDALLSLARYRAAFPKEHSAWAKANQKSI
ncbi:MAG: O-antigen ligase C-terminal domain-containing protein [Polaromonas sp.]|nr:O-antigen ligase C-terminal domain-containing protein [Polaromonas sp.]